MALAEVLPSPMHDYLEEDTFSAESVAVRDRLRRSVRGAVLWLAVDTTSGTETRPAGPPASMRGPIEFVNEADHGYSVVRMVAVTESDDDW